MKKRFTKVLIVAMGAVSVTGCQQYLARQDLIEPYSGNAVAHNLALQTPDPWPRHAYDNNIYTGGRRQANAYLNYNKKGEEQEAAPLSPLQLVVPQN